VVDRRRLGRRALLRLALTSTTLGTLPAMGLPAGCAAPPPPRPADDVAHPLAGLTDFEGATLPAGALPAILGRPATVVDFWASWCQPCRQGFRYLDQLYRTWLGRGLDVIAVSVDDDPVAARRFGASFRPRFPLAWDAHADVRDRFGVVSLPTTVLLDGEGAVVVRNTGFDLADHRALEEHVRRLVEG
jgi:thiol-disulfide isomerase/thioredoxin